MSSEDLDSLALDRNDYRIADLNEMANEPENQEPQELYDGLSKAQLIVLNLPGLHFNNIIRLRDDIDDEVMDQVPLFRLYEEYLKLMIKVKAVRMETSEQFVRKITMPILSTEAFSKIDTSSYTGYEYGEDEEDAGNDIGEMLQPVSICVSVGKELNIIGLQRNVLSFTKSGKKYVKNIDRLSLFKDFIKVAIAVPDFLDYDEDEFESIGNEGSQFSLYLILKYGAEPRKPYFYAEKYFNIYSELIDYDSYDFAVARDIAYQAFATKMIFKRFGWLNFMNMAVGEIDNPSIFDRKYVSNDLINKVFDIDATRLPDFGL